MTADRQATVFSWVMTALACVNAIAIVPEMELAARVFGRSDVNLGYYGATFLAVYFAGAPGLWAVLGLGLLDGSIKQIRDGSRAGPRLRGASFEPPARGWRR